MSRMPPINPQDHAQGSASAPATLVEYGDYECPYCGEFNAILAEVQPKLGDKLRLVFRNFPLTEIHPFAMNAARLAEAAASAGKFWEAHDLLYANQRSLSDQTIFAIGQKLGLDEKTLEAAFNGGFDDKIRADFSGGARAGVNGTPSLFINGHRYDGPRDPKSLITALTQAAQAQR